MVAISAGFLFYLFILRYNLKPTELERPGLEIYISRWKGVPPQVTEFIRPSVRTTVGQSPACSTSLHGSEANFPSTWVYHQGHSIVTQKKPASLPCPAKACLPKSTEPTSSERTDPRNPHLSPPPPNPGQIIKGTHTWGRIRHQ